MKQKKDLISIVIPCHNEERNVKRLFKAIAQTLKDEPFEAIFVDDGSKDATASEVLSLQEEDKRVVLVQLRTNYGKSAAYAAGFDHVRGDIVLTMDGDLQDDPKDIPRLLKKLESGYDFVSGWKKQKYKWYQSKALPSKAFNVLTSYITGVRLHDIDCPFRAMRREVLDEIRIYGELHRYIPVLAYKAGFKVTETPVQNHPRRFGHSKFGSGRLVKGSLDLLTVFFLTTYLKRPLHFFGASGIAFIGIGSLIGIWLFIQRFFMGVLIVKTWLLLLGVLLIVLGAQVLSLGLMGEMLTYLNSSKKKAYVIKRLERKS